MPIQRTYNKVSSGGGDSSGSATESNQELIISLIGSLLNAMANLDEEATQSDILNAIKNIDIPTLEGVSTEEKQDTIISAIANVNKILETPLPFGADTVTSEYTGTVLNCVKYREGGVTGTVLATATMTYDELNNLTAVVWS